MNATVVQQRFKFDIIIGFSHDTYIPSFLHMTCDPGIKNYCLESNSWKLYEQTADVTTRIGIKAVAT